MMQFFGPPVWAIFRPPVLGAVVLKPNAKGNTEGGPQREGPGGPGEGVPRKSQGRPRGVPGAWGLGAGGCGWCEAQRGEVGRFILLLLSSLKIHLGALRVLYGCSLEGLGEFFGHRFWDLFLIISKQQ